MSRNIVIRNSDIRSFRLVARTARWLGLLGPAAAGMLASSLLSAQDARASDTITARAADAPAGAYKVPVRINRSFFEKDYQQSVQITVNGSALDYSGRGTWKEQATDLPAPAPDESTGPVLADFRDFKACSSNDRAPGVGVCFNVMPDVSSVGMNAKEMKLEGLSQVVPSECSDAASQLAFKGATRSAYNPAGGPEHYTAEFSNGEAAGSRCALTIQVTFQR